MKVKVGNKIYDPNDEPVMVILEDTDKENISSMLPECKKYCAFPDSMTAEEINEWMKDSSRRFAALDAIERLHAELLNCEH